MYAAKNVVCPDCGESGPKWDCNNAICMACRGRLADATRFAQGERFVDCLKDLANPLTEMLTLAVAIADSSARHDLEWASSVVCLASGEWLDTGTRSPDLQQLPADVRARFHNQVVRDMRYLTLRGQLQRNTTFPHLVRFVDADQPAEPDPA